MEELRKKLILAFILMVLIIFFGTTGYMIIEGWNFMDALYMTIITLTTVGYQEVRDLSSSGIWFTIVLIIIGVGTMLYILSIGAKFILEGQIQQIFGRRRLEKKIKELKDHYIICGYGRMGKIIAKELKSRGVKTVVIEKNPVLSEMEEFLLLRGDATLDYVLKKAEIEKAKGLITVLPTDAENLYVVLSARGLNPDLIIVARAGEEGSEQKLLRAGANRVISPYYISGLRIAQMVLKPAVVDFLEFATDSGNIDLQMEEMPVLEGSNLAGITLDQCGIGRELGVIIVAIKKATGDIKFNPTFGTIVESGDTLIALGEISKLKMLEKMVKAKK